MTKFDFDNKSSLLLTIAIVFQELELQPNLGKLDQYPTNNRRAQY